MDFICKPTGKFNKDGTEKVQKLYYCPECKVNYLDELEKKEREAKQFDELCETIKYIHNWDSLPKIYWKLQDLRNGTIRYKGVTQRKYKKGVPFPFIKMAYEECQKDIQWARTHRRFDDPIKEFNYCFAIVQNKLPEVINKEKERRKQSNNPSNINVVIPVDEFNYSKQKRHDDISDILT